MATTIATLTRDIPVALRLDAHSSTKDNEPTKKLGGIRSGSHFNKGEDVVDEKTGVYKISNDEYAISKYPEWLPTWDPKEKYPAYPDDLNKRIVDRGHFADKDLKNFLGSAESIQIKKLSPKLGSEVRGVQLSELSDAAKDDLALLVADRGVVVFRDQDLKDKGLEFNKKFGEHFGPLHIHPSTGAPEGYSVFHVVYRKRDPGLHERIFAKTLSNRIWHSDVTYEKNPPGTTFFAILEGPETGGDTIFSDCEEAYNRLSPKFKEIISGLNAVHSSEKQAANSRQTGGIERRAPATNLHPLVRIHPVTKRKSLFVPGFIEEIDGLKKEESEAILNLLFDHVNNSHDFQIRASYEPGTVVAWDNRRVLHSATYDWKSGESRHCYRITPQAERPVGSEEELEEWNR